MDQSARSPHFFGYGSLVNRSTHEYAPVRAARVTGWRREWRRSPMREIAFLTVVRAPGVVLEGLMAEVPGADWAALDAREFAYERVRLGAEAEHDLHPETYVAIYAIPDGQHHAPTPASPVLLSYLDVVVQGYLREFGEEGVAGFFETTHGWDAPILDDRAAPLYPRHRVLTAAERDLVDRWLLSVDARKMP